MPVRLTNDQVAEIRKRCSTGVRGQQLACAREFGVGPSAIGKIVRGEAWQQRHLTPAERFEGKVQRDSGGGCDVWLGGFTTDDIGGKRRPWFWDGRRYVVGSRFAWEQTHGPIPVGLLVCHRCDNPSCVKPDHLFLGTSSDNRRDCVQKGRHATGPRIWTTRLSNEMVAEIRNRYVKGRGQLAGLARAYGVTPRTISLVVQRRIWKHVN